MPLFLSTTFVRGRQRRVIFIDVEKGLALFVLDSVHVAEHGGEQGHWLKKQLEKHRRFL